MSSSEDLFADTPELDVDDLTPPSSLTTISHKTSQSSKVGSTPSENPTPEPQIGLDLDSFTEEVKLFQNESMFVNENENLLKNTAKVKVEFFDGFGERTHFTSSTDLDAIDIVTSIIKSSDPDYKKSAINKLLKSEQFGQEIVDGVIRNLSKTFADFLSSQECPLRRSDIFSDEHNIEDLDLDSLLGKCKSSCPKLIEALESILFGIGRESEKQRLLTILVIGGYTQNQQINLIPKLMGEFLKRKNCSKQGLELLQRCGITLVSKSVSRDQDKIGENFLSDVKRRKNEIEVWDLRRKTLVNQVTVDMKLEAQETTNILKVKFVADDFSPKIFEIGKIT